MSAIEKKSKYHVNRLAKIILSPIVSEKSTFISERRNQISFKVLVDATKDEIKCAVELMFNVKVNTVSTLLQKGKLKRFSGKIGQRNNVKKAYVSLHAGQSLDGFLEGQQ
jgi:large subunit ribosomal protein L23